MAGPNQNQVSFRRPLNLPEDVHPDVRDALQFHDDGITDLRQANQTQTDNLNAALARIAALEKASK